MRRYHIGEVVAENLSAQDRGKSLQWLAMEIDMTEEELDTVANLQIGQVKVLTYDNLFTEAHIYIEREE